MDIYHYYEIAFTDFIVFARIIRDHRISKPLPGQILVHLHYNGNQYNSSFSVFFEGSYLTVIVSEIEHALSHCPLRLEDDKYTLSYYLKLFKVTPIAAQEMYADAEDAMNYFWLYQSQLFNPDDLSFLYIGFVRNLFTRPRPYEILKLSLEDEGVVLYFEIDYLFKLWSEYSNAKLDGKFENSNAEKNWLRVLNLLNTAGDAYNNKIEQASDYSTIFSNDVS